MGFFNDFHSWFEVFSLKLGDFEDDNEEGLRQKNEVQSTNTHPNKGIFLRITTMHATVFLNRCNE
jgi:hypothetical protein